MEQGRGCGAAISARRRRLAHRRSILGLGIALVTLLELGSLRWRSRAGSCWTPPAQSRRGLASAVAAAVASSLPVPAARAETTVTLEELQSNPLYGSMKALMPKPPEGFYDKEAKDPDMPPDPDPVPFIRQLQAESWRKEPYTRVRLHLLNVRSEVQPNPFLDLKYFVRWQEDETKYDILGEKAYKEAFALGKMVEDPNVSAKSDEFKAYIYQSPVDREYVETKVGFDKTIDLPQSLLDTMARIRSRPFGGAPAPAPAPK